MWFKMTINLNNYMRALLKDLSCNNGRVFSLKFLYHKKCENSQSCCRVKKTATNHDMDDDDKH